MKKYMLPLLLLVPFALASNAGPHSIQSKIEGFTLQDLQFLLAFSAVGGFSRIMFGVLIIKPWWWLEVIRDFFRGMLMAALLVTLTIVLGQVKVWVLIAISIFSGLEPQAALDMAKGFLKAVVEVITRSSGAGGGGK